MNIIECPYCGASIEIKINEINCKIFRHAFHKSNFTQVNPHISKTDISKLEIYGCGMPFWYDGKEIKYIDFSDNFIQEKLNYP